MPASSPRPKESEASRCGQNSPTSRGRPLFARNAMSRSPRSCTRFTRPPATSSLESTTGIQYCLKSAPIGVPGPVRVSSSLSSRLSIGSPSRGSAPSVRPAVERLTLADASRRLRDGVDGGGVLERGEIARFLAHVGRANHASHDLGAPGLRQILREQHALGLERLAHLSRYQDGKLTALGLGVRVSRSLDHVVHYR